jgi:uncharacterized protein YrrD
MPRVSELIGRTVISGDSGERIGTVSDVLLDPQSLRVLGLVMGGGLFRSEHVLPYTDVQTLGKDAIVARSAAGVVDPRQWHQRGSDSTRTSALKHRQVLTTSGRALGQIHDVMLDEGGAVDAFELAGSTLSGLMGRRPIVPQVGGITIGIDAVLVPDEAAAAMEGARGANADTSPPPYSEL